MAPFGSATTCNVSDNDFSLQESYILDQSGENISELDGSGNFLRSHVYAAGQLLATYVNNSTEFVFNDWLGTKRVVADPDGGIDGGCLSLPFGDELTCSGNVPLGGHHYTGKERDAESGLDNFEARYYGSSMGRFMSPDDFGGHLEDPQSLNKYSYVGNNPLSRTDPTGHDFHLGCSASDSALNCQRNNDTGQYEQGSYVKGADGNLSFQATNVHNDSTTGGLVDQQGNSYKGFVDASGVFFQRMAVQGFLRGSGFQAARIRHSRRMAEPLMALDSSSFSLTSTNRQRVSFTSAAPSNKKKSSSEVLDST